ncbi:RHS repeat-associated core domain-containing protein [Flavobacterium chilense]|uniref:RHS repeat-associated core domain-containing protein n=2 Tax=Flavobacterium chilense TaxID=946677 RepID=A0A1M7N1L5_9FLAO|nr:RHS repeat-associated core domain-containing protein [Flavobacterium chilense]SHM97300.1 RHS repeat-associated core domain-containing protein [Flavobacterium chilense]
MCGYQYENGILKFFPTTEGYIEPSAGSYKYVYQYKDHLGNVRLSYDKNLVIQEENNYYPFELKQEGYNTVKNSTSDALKYKYNGKELQDELGLNVYDYGARNYDPTIGRWMNVDPLAEKSRRFSPYTYALNNSIRFIDPDGMEATDWIKKGKNIFYDSAVTSQAQATEKYGKEAKHLDEGSTLTGTKGGEIVYQYTFHDNGTVTDKDGGTLGTTESTKTEGGTRIIGSDKKDGFKVSYGFNGSLGGGWGFDAGFIKDSGGNAGFFLSSNSNVGVGADTGFSFGSIKSQHSGPFLLEDAVGQSLSANVGIETPLGGIGLNYGGTFSSSLSSAQRLNLSNYGTSDTGRGNTEGNRSLIQSPSGKVSVGAMYRKSNTSVWQLN